MAYNGRLRSIYRSRAGVVSTIPSRQCKAYDIFGPIENQLFLIFQLDYNIYINFTPIRDILEVIFCIHLCQYHSLIDFRKLYAIFYGYRLKLCNVYVFIFVGNASVHFNIYVARVNIAEVVQVFSSRLLVDTAVCFVPYFKQMDLVIYLDIY